MNNKLAKRLSIIFGVGFLLVFVYAYFIKSAGAEVVTFYPTTCLGGWKNVEKAIGTPEVPQGMVSEYNDSNSASVSNSTSQIFCGGFKGKIPKDTFQKRIVVKFSWAEKNNNTISAEGDSARTVETNLPAEVGTEPELTPEPAPENSSLPESPQGKVENSSTPAEATQEEGNEPAPEPTPEPTPEPAPEPEQTSAEEPAAFLQLISKIAHAETAPDAGASPLAVEENLLPDARLEVFYTTDGNEWKSLGFVKDIHNGVEFEMPLGLFNTVEDLEKVQIAIHTIPTYDNVHTIYLDSVWLEVEYESPNALGAKGITNFKIFVLPQDRLESEVNDWLSLQKNIEVDDIKVEDYGGGGYLIVISYHSGGILGNSTARLKLIIGENPEADAQTFLSTLLPDQKVSSITATSGAFSNQQTTITVPIIFIVYE